MIQELIEKIIIVLSNKNGLSIMKIKKEINSRYTIKQFEFVLNRMIKQELVYRKNNLFFLNQ